MRKKLKIAAILFAMTLVTVGFLTMVYCMQDQQETPKEVKTWEVTNYAVADVKAIHICNSAGEEYSIVISEDDVSIDGIALDVPLQEMAMISIVNRILHGVSYSEPIQVEKFGLAEYGLNEPQAIFTIVCRDGSATSLWLGNQTVKKNGYYLWVEHTQTVYVVENVYQVIASYSAYDYIDPILAQIPQERAFTISQLSLYNRETGETISVMLKDYDGGETASVYSYMITRPGTYDASDDKLRAYIFDYLKDFQAESVYSLDVSPKSLMKLGLTEPAYTLELEDALTGTLRIDFSRLSDGTVLALMEGRPVIYQMAEEDVPFLGMTLDRFVSPFITLQPITDVDCFTVFDGESTYTFVLRQTDGEDDLQVIFEGEILDSDSFRKLYTRATTIYIAGVANPPEESEPVLRLTYHKTDGEECVVEFLPLDGRYCYVKVDGEGRFSVYLSDIEYFLEGLTLIVRGDILE